MMTLPYDVLIAPAARRYFLHLSTKQRKAILMMVESLGVNPHVSTATRIEGMTGLFCQVAEGIRLIYKVEEQTVLLLLIK